MPPSPEPNGSFLSNIISASYRPPAGMKSKWKPNDPSMSYNCKRLPSATGWRHRTFPCKNTPAQASLPPFPGRLPPGARHARHGGRARQRGGFHHLQDIRHRMMQSQWQRQKQCQIHSLLTIVWQQPPQRTPLCTLLMPSAYRPPRSRPGFTRCNPYTAAAAKWARPRKYLIGTLFLAYHNASGCLSARLRCLDFRIIAWKSERNCIFLPPAPIGSPYVRLRASDYNKGEVWISRKLACTGEKMTANEHAGSSSVAV